MNTTTNTIIAAVAAIIIALVLGAAYEFKYKHQDTIVVTGSAETDFTADLIVWNGDYTRYSMDLKEAYARLKEDEKSIRAYLGKKGIPNTEIVFSSISISKNFDNRYDEHGRSMSTVFTGYSLMQSVKIESSGIEKVEEVSREVTELIQQGIELNSAPPQYYFSKLSELKIDLLAKASEDAKTRAETIADNAGSSVGDLKKATMGVFQIIGKNSGEDYSYGGAFNTTSKHKTATITLKTEYTVD